MRDSDRITVTSRTERSDRRIAPAISATVVRMFAKYPRTSRIVAAAVMFLAVTVGDRFPEFLIIVGAVGGVWAYPELVDR